jgi:hypothetical protein
MFIGWGNKTFIQNFGVKALGSRQFKDRRDLKINKDDIQGGVF